MKIEVRIFDPVYTMCGDENEDDARLRSFIQTLDLPADDKARLLAITPATYIGIAPQLI